MDLEKEIVFGVWRYYASVLRTVCRETTLHHNTHSRCAADALAYYEFGETCSLDCYKRHPEANTEYGVSFIPLDLTVMIFGSNGETLAEYDAKHYPFLHDWYWTITPSARQKVTELMNAGNWQSEYWTIFLYDDLVWPKLFEKYYGTGDYPYHND